MNELGAIIGRIAGVLASSLLAGKSRDEALANVAREALSMRTAEDAADLRALAKFESFRP